MSKKENMTIKEALSKIRRQGKDKETVYYFYVTDNRRRLVGVVTVRDLLLAEEDKTIKDVMEENVISINTHTDKPGISAIFDRGIVTYTNRAKIEELGVKKETLEKYTEYSLECAYEMAEGLYKVSGSDLCVSFTGIAGPDGGTEENPVGTYYIGICYKGNCKTYKFYEHRPGRDIVRNSAVQLMFRTIYKTIQGLA